MSNFRTFTPMTAGQPGVAPLHFCGSTDDVAAVVLATGYMNDKSPQIKVNDIVWVTHDILASPPYGVVSLYKVVLVGQDFNLVLF